MDENEDLVTRRVLEWCGKFLPPMGFGNAERDLLKAGADIDEYRRVHAWKVRYQDDSIPGERDMVRRPYGSNAPVY